MYLVTFAPHTGTQIYLYLCTSPQKTQHSSTLTQTNANTHMYTRTSAHAYTHACTHAYVHAFTQKQAPIQSYKFASTLFSPLTLSVCYCRYRRVSCCLKHTHATSYPVSTNMYIYLHTYYNALACIHFLQLYYYTNILMYSCICDFFV